MKKILSFVLVLAISITTISSLSFSASAGDDCPEECAEFEEWLDNKVFARCETIWVGNFRCGFRYENVNTFKDTIFICDTKEKGDTLTIPETITYNLKEYTVNAFFAAKDIMNQAGDGSVITTVDTSYMLRTFKKNYFT